MTEEDAKTKWCPFIRVTGTFDGMIVSNRVTSAEMAAPAPPDSNFNTRCIASACMAWHFDTLPTENFPGYSWDNGRWVKTSEVKVHVPQPAGPHHHRHGHCGLAGKP